jgi:phosphatidylinositol kinase/protein kinase (PI-3  family)
MNMLWQQQGEDMDMVCYKIIETGNQVGYLEFVDKSPDLTDIHKQAGRFFGAYQENSIFDFY